MATGQQLRDDGIALVNNNSGSWGAESDAAFNYWLAHVASYTFTIEQFRVWATARGLQEPHHPNAWGGLARRYRNQIACVGFTTSERPQAHARATRVYMRKYNDGI